MLTIRHFLESTGACFNVKMGSAYSRSLLMLISFQRAAAEQ
nr:hypothetical protein Iba_chr01dCG12840 [Ipomoea batatas]